MNAPSPARVYDALLGGSHNFEIDRRAAEAGIAMVPDLAVATAANRRFLRRAVTALAEAGITQFIDVGAGIPTVGNTHEIVRAIHPEGHVVYVDIDAVAVAHAQAILAGDGRTVAIRADARAPDEMLAAVADTGLIDPSRPVGVLMVALLHLVPDDADPAGMTARLRQVVAPGSHLVISHLSSAVRAEEGAALSRRVAERDRVSLIFRSREDIEAFFGDFTLLPPGLTEVTRWRPDASEVAAGPDGGSLILVGVGRKD